MLWNKTLKLREGKKTKKTTAIQSRGTLYLQASKCYTAVVLITHEWSTKARWHDQELWQRGKALIKCPAHVAFKGFCQQESGSFPKPWSMSVILTTGFRNQKRKKKNTTARSQNTPHICQDLLRLRGLFHCCRGRTVFLPVTTRTPVTCVYLHTWAHSGASDSFRLVPMFWLERAAETNNGLFKRSLVGP